jgi:DMSO/TMAO reductase YedYZ heme-binding membrane subunit
LAFFGYELATGSEVIHTRLSKNEAVAVIVTAVLFAVGSGRGDLVWKTLGELRRIAMTNARRD